MLVTLIFVLNGLLGSKQELSGKVVPPKLRREAMETLHHQAPGPGINRSRCRDGNDVTPYETNELLITASPEHPAKVMVADNSSKGFTWLRSLVFNFVAPSCVPEKVFADGCSPADLAGSHHPRTSLQEALSVLNDWRIAAELAGSHHLCVSLQEVYNLAGSHHPCVSLQEALLVLNDRRIAAEECERALKDYATVPNPTRRDRTGRIIWTFPFLHST